MDVHRGRHGESETENRSRAWLGPCRERCPEGL